MDWLQLDHITPRTLFLLAVALLAGWMVLKATKHLLLSLLCLAIAVLGIGYVSGVITLDHAKAAGGAVVDKASEGVQAASERAKKLGELGHSTSAGSASQTNPAYRKHVEGGKAPSK